MGDGKSYKVKLRPKNWAAPSDKWLPQPVLPIAVRLGRADDPNAAQWQTLDFIWDSGSTFTTMPAPRAQRLGIAFPAESKEFDVQLSDRRSIQVIHQGEIHTRIMIAGLSERVFRWPSHFVELAPDATGEPPNRLGLAGVIYDLRVTLDGTPSAETALGWLLLEETNNPARQTLESR